MRTSTSRAWPRTATSPRRASTKLLAPDGEAERAPAGSRSPAIRSTSRSRTRRCSTALDIAWIKGEAERQGADLTDTEVQQAFQQTKGAVQDEKAEYVKARDQSGLTEDEVLERAQAAADQQQDPVEESPTASRRRRDERRPGLLRREQGPSSSSPSSATSGSSRTRTRTRSTRDRGAAGRMTPQRAGRRWPPSTRPTRPPRTRAECAATSCPARSSSRSTTRSSTLRWTRSRARSSTSTGSYVFEVETATPEDGQRRPSPRSGSEGHDQIKTAAEEPGAAGGLRGLRQRLPRLLDQPDDLRRRLRELGCDNFNRNPDAAPAELTAGAQQQAARSRAARRRCSHLPPAPGSIVPFSRRAPARRSAASGRARRRRARISRRRWRDPRRQPGRTPAGAAACGAPAERCGPPVGR